MDLSTCLLRVLLIILFSGNSFCVSTEGQKILRDLKEYYIFKPIQNGHDGAPNSVATLVSEDHGIHMKTTILSFFANNTLYELELELNEDFLPDHFSTSYSRHDGSFGHRKQSKKAINNCYYQGTIKGMNGSHVVASTCHGLRGTMFLTHDVLQFQPVDEHGSMHVLFRPRFMLQQSCGNFHFDSFREVMTGDFGDHPRLKRATKEKKFIELLVVADNQEFKAFGSREALHDHVKEVVNHIDSLYKKLDLRVVLLHIEVWENEDKIESHDDAQKVLSEFLKYRQNRIHETAESSPWRYTDNAQLLYGGNFQGTTVGMATVSTMCGLRSGGVNEDKKSALRTAATVAHEMGHNLGMSHDTGDCSCNEGKCVMAPTASFTAPGGWSDCSVDYLNKGFESGTDTCLMNVPDSDRLFGGPKCGNGIVEKDEECDCGLVDECESKCCNATTCRLLPDADCDDGACCTSDCRFKKTCSLCRAVGNDCDIAEYCTGHSSHCPGNIHKIDGVDCRNGQGICYGGVCRSHEMQCQEIWGPAATNGKIQCYQGVNKKGDANGNCGQVDDKFIACTPANAVCGKLQCIGGEEFPLVAKDRVFYRNSFPGFMCKSISSASQSSDVGDPGLVWDGTKCGEGQICFAGECKNISAVLLTCSSDCSGHGICNNFGNCHCDEGWSPPDCSRKGDGGSYDSGPICVNSTDMQVVLMLVFFLLILPLILGLMFWVWWRYCGGQFKVRAWSKNRQYRKGKTDTRRPDTGATHVTETREPPTSHVAETWEPPPTSPPAKPVPPLSWSNGNTRPAVHSGPSRPAPSMPVRNAPPPPRPVNTPLPASTRPTNPPPPPKPTFAGAPRPSRPPVAHKPKVPPPVQRPANTVVESDGSVSIQDRIARLQNTNFV